MNVKAKCGWATLRTVQSVNCNAKQHNARQCDAMQTQYQMWVSIAHWVFMQHNAIATMVECQSQTLRTVQSVCPYSFVLILKCICVVVNVFVWMSKPNLAHGVLIAVGIKTLPALLSHQGRNCPMQKVFVQIYKFYLSEILKFSKLLNVFIQMAKLSFPKL